MGHGMGKLRIKLYRQFYPKAWTGQGLSPVNLFIIIFVLASVVTVALETEKSISEPYAEIFQTLNIVFLLVFSIEYITRIWVMGEHPEYQGVFGRIKYIFSLVAIIDLIAIIPFLLGFIGSDTFLLRLIRLSRILVLARLGAFTSALTNLRSAVASRGYELLLSAMFTLGILLVSAVILFVAEKDHQPEAFGSIPRAMWWAVATLTTVGYGDVYPVTPVGKVFAALSALSSLGLIALPAGILAGAFGEAFRKNRESDQES